VKIDVPSLDATAGDVETQVVLPLLTANQFLSIPLSNIKSKEYLPARDIGKGSSSRRGYVPDFVIYISALPVCAIEVKSPTESVGVAYKEAALYALELNKPFANKINPCAVIIATNGIEILVGHWDSEPFFAEKISDLLVGSEIVERLRGLLSFALLERDAKSVSKSLRTGHFDRPSSRGEGPAMLASKLEPNTFAADLSPILRRYFSSRDQNKDPDIFSRAYISSNEITSYDRNLEAFLKDRLARSKTRVEVVTSRKKASAVSKRLSEFDASRGVSGDLQLVTGGVGAGKSLFARRYKEFLQPAPLAERNHWAFVDFNDAPDDLSNIEEWVCRSFVESILDEGAPIDLNLAVDQERIFATKLVERQAFYDRMEQAQPSRGLLERARDIEAWRQEPRSLADGVSRFLQGDRAENVVVVFDNVDRRDTESQLSAFQTALWFMAKTRALVILQMRDSTFELHKDEPPLDTYKTGQIFHISPPRFVDVVKRRLELSLHALAQQAPETIKYKTPSGITISYPKTRAGEFLTTIYRDVFERRSNISRIMEALAGRNVRRALDMFMAVITSGHMPEDLITNVAAGGATTSFPEHRVLKILMRQDYRFFNDTAGFVSNIFYCDPNWVRPSNFIVVEVLYFLVGYRKSTGDNGQLGYYSAASIASRLERFGFVQDDVFGACRFALKSGLIEAETAATKALTSSDCFKASASGWAHIRLLSERLEYLSSILPSTAMNDEKLNDLVFDRMQIENQHGDLTYQQRQKLVEQFCAYLRIQHQSLKVHPGYASAGRTGAEYVISKVQSCIEFSRIDKRKNTQMDWLD